MRILIICGVLPPRVSATALLIDKMLPLLKAKDVKVEGLTVKESFSDPDTYVYKGIKMHRANCVLSPPIRVNGVGDFCYKAAKRLGRYFGKQEKTKIFRKDVVRGFCAALKRLKPEQYDCILAACAYYEAGVALMEYKKRYGLKTPIVLYQLDPLAENPQFVSMADMQAYEQEMYKNYSCVLTTPIIYAAKQARGWPLENAIPIEQPIALADVKKTEPKERNVIKCLYAGYLYGGLRDAGFTLDLFSKIQDPRIHFFVIGRGQEELLRRYEEGALKGRLHCLGEKTSEECDRFIQDADILVNIGNTDAMFVPSKLLHYIGFGKPILDIVGCENCPTIPYMEQYKLSKCVRDTSVADSECVQEVEAWILNNLGVTITQEEICRNLRTCTPEFIANQIYDAMLHCKDVKQQQGEA